MLRRGGGGGQIGIREGRGYFKFYKIHEFYNLFWLRSLDYHLSTIELHYCLRNVSILLRNTRRVENKTGLVRGGGAIIRGNMFVKLIIFFHNIYKSVLKALKV